MRTTCRCGAPLPPYIGRGRPRVRCEACATKSQVAKDWRASHPEEVAQYNERRRADYAVEGDLICARRRLAYALKVGRRVERARRQFELATQRAADPVAHRRKPALTEADIERHNARLRAEARRHAA